MKSQTEMHVCHKRLEPRRKCLDWNYVWIFLTVNPSDSKRHHCRGRSLSADRQNSSTDPRLQAGIMPVPIEIFDSDPGPVWSCMPSHCACIFSGLQVSGHDSAQGKRTQIKWTITHKLMELSAPTLTFFGGDKPDSGVFLSVRFMFQQ